MQDISATTIYSASCHFTITREEKVGVLGQVCKVSDRDAQHRPSTRSATRVKKKGGGGGGSKLYILPNLDEK